MRAAIVASLPKGNVNTDRKRNPGPVPGGVGGVRVKICTGLFNDL